MEAVNQLKEFVLKSISWIWGVVDRSVLTLNKHVYGLVDKFGETNILSTPK